MFSNLLYFLIVLVIYSTSELFKPSETLANNTQILNFFLISAAFAAICHLSFKRIETIADQNSNNTLDHLIQNRINRLSVLALFIYAVNLYIFKINLIFSGIRLFDLVPTFKAVVCIGVYLLYLIIIWNAAYPVQTRSYITPVSKKSYIISNISFSLPALFPWFCLSLAADILDLVPWPVFRNFIKSPVGEMSYMFLFVIAIAVFGPVFIKKVWNCKPMGKGYKRSRIESTCSRAGLSYSDILTWDLFGGNMMTAGIMGFIGRFRYLLITPALINALNDEELDTVILHEIGHVRRHHMIFYLLFFMGFMAITFVFFEPVILLLYLPESIYKMFSSIAIERSTTHSVLITLTLIVSFILYFRFIFGFYMRNFERQADLHVYQFIQDASALISTFYKIAAYSRQSLDKPNWHHFSIGQRIDFLERCEKKPALIHSHHKKIKKMVLIYLLTTTILISLGFSLRSGPGKDLFETYLAEAVLLNHLDVDPSNSDLYTLVGDHYYSRSNYEQAIVAYENVLRIDPENVHALNNLSWLLSTCPQESFRNLNKALEYATKALELKKEPYILDTYAEALFGNNDVDGAIAAAREALALSKEKKDYYENQVKRFESMRVQ